MQVRYSIRRELAGSVRMAMMLLKSYLSEALRDAFPAWIAKSKPPAATIPDIGTGSSVTKLDQTTRCRD